MPAIRPPPPTGTKIASIASAHWRMISAAIVPWPAITSGSSYGWMNTRPSGRGDAERVPIGVVEGVAVQHGAAAEGLHGLDLDRRRGGRHDDQRVDAERAAGHGDALGVVAGRRGDDAAPAFRLGEAAHAVVGAAHLEREGRLQALALEQDGVAEAGREARDAVERRLDGDVGHARAQNAAQVVVGQAHRASHSAGAAKGKPEGRLRRPVVRCPSGVPRRRPVHGFGGGTPNAERTTRNGGARRAPRLDTFRAAAVASAPVCHRSAVEHQRRG